MANGRIRLKVRLALDPTILKPRILGLAGLLLRKDRSIRDCRNRRIPLPVILYLEPFPLRFAQREIVMSATATPRRQLWSFRREIGAEEGTRTPTPLRVHGPEPCASANSATSARINPAQRGWIGSSLSVAKPLYCVKPGPSLAPFRMPPLVTIEVLINFGMLQTVLSVSASHS
jgi:hypothetical protein